MLLFENVESSTINSIAYEGTELFVKFTSGSTYKYKDVPKELFESLKTAESKGRFFATNIKNNFEYERMPA